MGNRVEFNNGAGAFRIAAWVVGWVALAIAAILGLVSAASAQTIDEYEPTGFLYIEIITTADPETGWNFELVSSQTGCSNQVLTLDSPWDNFADFRQLDDSDELCVYTLTAVDLPANFEQPPAQSFTFENGFVDLTIPIVDISLRETIAVDVVVPGSVDASTIPDAFELSLRSEQAGCTNRTRSLSTADVETLGEISLAGEVLVERTGTSGAIDDVIVVLSDGSYCEYTLALTGLPDGWMPSRVVNISQDPARWDDPDQWSDFGGTQTFVMYRVDSLAAVHVTKAVNGDPDEVPAAWEFELINNQAGCTSATLSVPSMNAETVEGTVTDVAPSDDLGEPCVYDVIEINVPDGWSQATPISVWAIDPLTIHASVRNNHVASATAGFSVWVSSQGDPALAPEFFDYEFTSRCLVEPVVVTIASADTFEPSARDEPAASFDGPMFDADGVLCRYTVNGPPFGTTFYGGVSPAFPIVGFDFDYVFDTDPRDFEESGPVQINVSTNDTEPPLTWNYDLSSSQVGCTNRSITVEGLVGDTGELAWVDEAGDWCVYSLVAVDLPANLVPLELRAFSFLGLREEPQLTFEYIDPSERTSINFDSILIAPSALPNTLSFELTTNQPGCTTRTLVVDEGISQVMALRIDDVATFDLSGAQCLYVLAPTGLPEGWIVEQRGYISLYRFASPTEVVSYLAGAPAVIAVAKQVDGDLGQLPATWDFELTSDQAGCTSALVSIPSVASAEVRGAFVDVETESDAGEPCRYLVGEVNVPDGWLPPQPKHLSFDGSGDIHFQAVEFTNTDFATATVSLELFVNSFGDPALAPEYWEFTITSRCLAEPMIIDVLAAPTFARDVSFDSPQRRNIELPRFDVDANECADYQIVQTPTAAFESVTNVLHELFRGPRDWEFVSFNNRLRRDGDDSYVFQPVDDDTVYVSQPVDGDGIYVSQPAAPTAVPITSATAVPIAPAPAPIVVAPVVTAPLAPTPVVTAATYGFSNSLPTAQLGASAHQPKLAVTGATSGSLTGAAAMLLLAGVFFVALSRAPKRRRGTPTPN